MELHTTPTPSLARRLSSALWELRVLNSLDSSDDILSCISLDSSNSEVTLKSLRLLQHLIPKHTYACLQYVPGLVELLTSNDTAISRAALNCMAVCIKVTPLTALDCLRKGLDSPDENIKRQCLRALSMFKDNLDQELLQRVLKLITDPAVSSTAYYTANELIPNSPILRNSSSPHARKTSKKLNSKSSSIIKKRNYWKSLRFLPNWKEKEIDEMSSPQDKLEVIEDVQKYVKQNGFRKILQDLLIFLQNFMVEVNSVVVYASLQLLEFLLSYVGITRSGDFTAVIQGVILKLGDNRINIRFISGKLLRSFLKELGADIIISYLLEKLHDTNWHVREEILYLIIYTIQVRNHKFYYDFLNIVTPVSTLLNDSKSKIRFVALETLRVIAEECGFSEVSNKAREVLDDLSFNKLRARFKNKDIASVRADGTIDLPKAIPSSAPISISDRDFDSFIKSDVSEDKPIISEFNQKLAGIVNRRGSSARLDRTKLMREIKLHTDSESPKNINSRSRMLFQESPPVLKNITFEEKQSKTPTRLVRSIQQPVKAAFESPVKFLTFEEKLSKTPTKSVKSNQRSIKPVLESPAKYLISEELDPIPYPQFEFEKLTLFKSEDWNEQFEMLNIFRRLLKHHKECITKNSIHTLLITILTCIDSLRSSVSKNALIALNDMFEQIPRLIEPELDMVLGYLLKKSTDTNIFIASEAEHASATMCLHCNEAKVMSSLISLSSTVRLTAVKSKIAACIQNVARKLGKDLDRCREIDKIIQVLSNGLYEASLETRQASKNAMIEVSNLLIFRGPDFDRLLKRALNDASYRQVKQILSKTGRESPIKILPKSADFKLKAKKVQNNYLAVLTETERGSDEKSFRLNKSFDVNRDEIAKSGIVENLDEGLNSDDPKVVAQAIGLLSRYLKVGSNIDRFTYLLPSVLSLTDSVTSSIREGSKTTCRRIARVCKLNRTIPELLKLPCPTPKTLSFQLSLVAELLPRVRSSCPEIVSGHLYPFIMKLFEENTDEKILSKIVIRVYNVLGDQIIKSLPSQYQDRLIQILKSEM